MSRANRIPFILLLFIITTATFAMLVPDADAYRRYNDGCQNCHGEFSSGVSPKGTIFDYHSINKQEMRRNPYGMSSKCMLCHAGGDKNNPYIGFSKGTSTNPGLGCVGCQGREEDAGHDSASAGLGAGLRQHHFNANKVVYTVNGPVSSQICADCHSDANPANYTPVGEHVKPIYYGTKDTFANNPCNSIMQHEINENWDFFDFEGLDNDGDGLYDLNDPDCQTAEIDCFDNIDNDCDGLIDC